ncbi:hypothetical protein CAL7716_106170 (plasmid) [Calothrix sp. PCC 7716]|nr:hypothetical protein CAL7716_106170 [Calothrix sp. PCC 7716]
MKINKYVISGLAAILFSPVFFEIPVLWHWAEVRASERFLADNITQKSADDLPQTPGIHVWGSPSCVYTKSLVETLDKWGFNYVYHDIGSWQQSHTKAPEMWEIVRRVNPNKQWSLPVVDVNGTPVVGNGTNIEDVAKVLAEQGQLPLQYIPIRAGTRMMFIFILEVFLVLNIQLIYISFGISRKLSSKRIS